jgi:hypothetical protein
MSNSLHGEVWADLAIWRGGLIVRQCMFYKLCRQYAGSNGPQTLSASWHVEEGLLGESDEDELYGPLMNSKEPIKEFVKSVRSGDRLALVAMSTGRGTMQVCEKARLDVYYED